MATSTARHRKPTAPNPALARAAGVTAAGAAIPLLAAGTSHAATTTVWDKVAACESSGDWHINTGNGFYGGLQFTASTWREFGGTRYAPRADLASRTEQITIAKKVLAGQGPRAWPICSVRAGLTRTNGQAAAATTPTTHPASTSKAAATHHTGTSGTKTSTTKTTTTQRQHRHTVRSGETLSGIAAAHHVPGGWHALYAENRTVIGADPNLIHPGQILHWTTAAHPAPAAVDPAPAAPKTHKPTTKTARAAKPKAAKPASAGGHWAAPVRAHYRVSEAYGLANSRYEAGHHTGIDLAVPTGTSVHAVTGGTVVHASWGGSYGNLVKIRGADGKYVLYAHLSRIDVRVGAHVTAGQRIASSGATGNVTGPHLHLEVDTTEHYGSDINPVSYLAAHGIHLT